MGFRCYFCGQEFESYDDLILHHCEQWDSLVIHRAYALGMITKEERDKLLRKLGIEVRE